MNLTETKELLARIAAVDNRDLSEATALAWHDVIGSLSYRVADRALTLARRDPQINWIEPRHILAKVHLAVAELNREAQAELEPEESDWQPCDRPANYDEMVEFYNKLWEACPWDRYTKTGSMTRGTTYTRPQPIEVRVGAAELDRRIRMSAQKMGWTIPEPRWN